MGPIDVYLVSHFEEKFDSSQNAETAPFPSGSGYADRPASTEKAPETNEGTSSDFMSGIMKIVPSEIDSEADYWLLSDSGISIADMWRTEPDVEWNELASLNDDFVLPQTPPANAADGQSSADNPAV